MNNWWKEAIFYHVYLRSFQDSNGDGIGDLQGLINRLDYIADLGIDGIWISPFYQSPHVDFGYDISNHKAVDPRYGTLEDFDKLIEEANKRNIKIVVDIILNHTSDQHPFFIESRQSKDSEKRDWYIWCDPKPDGSPPNNWQGFEPSTWKFDEKTQQYYYHYFYVQQPDLNWRNSDVITEMFSICDFWINKGAAALRLDAINYLVEDPELKDNPITDGVPDYLRNIYQFNQDPIHNLNHPDNHEVLKKLRQHIRSNHPEDPLLIGEIWVPNTQELVNYYGTNDDELQLPFNFFLSTLSQLNAVTCREMLEDFERTLGNFPTTVVLSNHDFPRSTVRYSQEKDSDQVAKLLATFLLTLKGIPFIYYGEELGLRDNPPDTIEEVQDPRGKIDWPSYKGRDGCRTPMPWNNSLNGGFTEGKPWYKLPLDYQQRNVENQVKDPDSILNYYKQVIKIRRNVSALRRGNLILLGDDPNLLAYSRTDEKTQAIIVLNMSSDRCTFELLTSPTFVTQSWSILLSTHNDVKSKTISEKISLQPFEGLIIVPN
ncbi:MAG: alpha-glucosidase [Crocosphaera sp.]|nr:alpha-glucosidase [Crocosphaera sp.]